MVRSVRVKVASVLLAAIAVAGVGVGMSEQAQAAGVRYVYGVKVEGYLGDGYWDSGRGWEWWKAWQLCTTSAAFNGVRSVKHLKTEYLQNDEYRIRYACSSSDTP